MPLQIAENARSARSEDIYKIRTRGIRHILGTDFETSSFNPPLDPFGDKIHRGWNHPQTARALCPLHSLENFDNDPEYVSFQYCKSCSRSWQSIHGWHKERANEDQVRRIPDLPLSVRKDI